MERWNELRGKLIEALLGAEAGMKDEQEMILRWALEEMDNLDKKHHKKNMVYVTDEEYNELSHDSEFLNCLEACGVDNWVGYEDALSMMEEE